MREFKLKGTPEEQLKKLEKILPRLAKASGSRGVVGVMPPTIINHYCAEPKNGVIFKGMMFEGKIRKICLGVDFIEGDTMPEYYVSVRRGAETRVIRFATKKASYIGALEFDTKDGDRIEVGLENPSVVVKDIYLAVIFQAARSKAEMVTLESPDTNLLEDPSDEGI